MGFEVGDVQRRHTVAAAVVWAAIMGGTPVVFAGDYFTLIVAGASGGGTYVDTYARWRQELVSALRDQAEFRDDHLIVLAETPGPGVGRASREGVTQAFRDLRARMTDTSVLLVVLMGHGTYDGVAAKFNLVGPDLESTEWAALLDNSPGRTVFVNTTAASYPFVRQLARSGRIVIAVTSTSAQRYDTVFPEFFVKVLTQESADADRNGRVSVWEAFEYTSAEVRRWYQRQGRLATERAILDDSGDGSGREAGKEGRDGVLAAQVFVGAGVDPPLTSSDPSLVPLVERRDALEDQVADLRSRRDDLGAVAYERELERLLIELARVSREIRRRTVASGVYRLNQYRSPGGASRLTALLLGRIRPGCSLVAPWRGGAPLQRPPLIESIQATS